MSASVTVRLALEKLSPLCISSKYWITMVMRSLFRQ
jgi:hypothetical protein